MSVPLQQLVTAHKAATSERAKAQIEAQIWNAASAEDRQTIKRRLYMHNILPHAKTAHMEDRSLLFNANIEALWQRVDADKMPLTTAVGRFHTAQNYVREHGVSVDDAIKVALDEYDSWPKQKSRSGVVYNRRPRSQIGHEHTTPIVKRPNQKKIKKISEEAAKSFWLDIRVQVVKFYAERLVGLDPLTANRLQRDFCIDLQTLCDEHGTRIDRTRHETRTDAVIDASVKFIHVREACELLGIDPPARGHALDLTKANKNKKNLARQYHPDIAGETKREKYHAVLGAYETLTDYMEQIQIKRSTTNGEAAQAS